eukprot:CAMPEP_0202849574 /NCGR_PEP_ID=MMETSP1389-20130828/81141_1 /ASSEMBLY_ACC=CAM_ASM_000865 /TAXON_ID=302021 /ORGANISM="Rhodomonas sp., Strain CCMP768" /LENGTH=30 /DNA_ID= /DNA_START= /DNA_END= /DNA_ORIENTATION=
MQGGSDWKMAMALSTASAVPCSAAAEMRAV